MRFLFLFEAAVTWWWWCISRKFFMNVTLLIIEWVTECVTSGSAAFLWEPGIELAGSTRIKEVAERAERLNSQVCSNTSVQSPLVTHTIIMVILYRNYCSSADRFPYRTEWCCAVETEKSLNIFTWTLVHNIDTLKTTYKWKYHSTALWQ